MINKVKQIELTLDSLSYKCVINKNEEIQIILPCNTLPERTQIFEAFSEQGRKERSVILKAANPVRLSIYFVNKTKESPKVTLTCSNKDSKVDGQVSLQPESRQVYEFMSVDGGLNWLVSSLSSSSGSSSGETTIVNGKTGPNIIIKASDIETDPINGKSGTIQEQLEYLASKIVKVEEDSGADNVMNIIAENSDRFVINAIQI